MLMVYGNETNNLMKCIILSIQYSSHSYVVGQKQKICTDQYFHKWQNYVHISFILDLEEILYDLYHFEDTYHSLSFMQLLNF